MERQEGQKLSRSEEMTLELKVYFKDCQFGDPKYQAFFDFEKIEELTHDAYELAKKERIKIQ